MSQKTTTIFHHGVRLGVWIALVLISTGKGSPLAFSQNELSRDLGRALPLDGAAFDGKLVAADEKWELTFEADAGKRKISAVDLLRWGRPAELRRGPVVVLGDGSLLRADVIEFDGTRVKMASALFGDVNLAGEMVAGIVFELPVDIADADRLLDWAAGTIKLTTNTKRLQAATIGGRISLLNGDVLAGRVLRFDGDNVRFETEVGPVTTDLERVKAVRFDRPLENDPTPEDADDKMKAWIGLGDGSLLLAGRFFLDKKKLSVSLMGNARGKTAEWITSPDELVFLQPIGPKAVYLSDLATAEYRHVPYLQMPWPYGIDRDATGGRLRSSGRLFVKGLGVHSSARLTYLLDKPFSRFEASTTIDDSAAGRGSVRFRVYVDGQKKHGGQIVRGQDAAVPVSVDVRGAKRLDLIVDFADRAGQEDHADWLDARLLR